MKTNAPKEVWICFDGHAPALATWTKDFRDCDVRYVKFDQNAALAIAERLDALALLHRTHADRPLSADELEPVINAVLKSVTSE